MSDRQVSFIRSCFRREWSAIGAKMRYRLILAMKRGEFIFQKHTQEFEERLAKFVGVKHAVAVNSGTGALFLSLKAAGIGPGDEIIVPSHTYIASINVIVHCGATPVLVDVRTEDHLMALDQVEMAINARTRAIMPVHLNGRVCDMTRLMALANSHGLRVFEDAAQALGAKHAGQMAGSFGATGSFSFYPAKLLGSYGELGAVTTNDDELARKIQYLRSHGELASYLRPAGPRQIYDFGYGMLPDNLQCAVINVKLDYLPDWIRRRRAIAKRYDVNLRGQVPLWLPPRGAGDVFQNYVIRSRVRDDLQYFLQKNGVETLISWPVPNHLQGGLTALSGYSLPGTEQLSREVLSLPCNHMLRDEEVDLVCDTIKRFYGARG